MAELGPAVLARASNPEWWKVGVVYQIYPRSFARGTWQVTLSTHGRTRGESLAGPVILASLEALIAYD